MTLFVAEPDRAYAQAAPDDPNLSGLAVAGAPDDANTDNLLTGVNDFAVDTTTYTVRIPFVDSGVVVTPSVSTPTDDNDASNDSVIRVNGTVVASGADHNVNLAGRAGMTTSITIHVTAPLRSVTKTYTVKVYRDRQSRSNNANLASLGISGVSLSPSFSAGTTSYKARVQAETVTLSYRLSDTGGGAAVGTIGVTADGDNDDYDADTKKVTLGDSAVADANTGGTTTITIPVTAEDGSPNSYSIEVYRIRSNRQTNANLATLTSVPVAGAPVGGGFQLDVDHTNGTTLNYNQRVNNATTHVTIAATKADAGAMDPAINPSDALRGDDDIGHQVAVRAGAVTTITIMVIAEDTAVRQTYTVKVYRERATRSDNNNLNSLSLSAGTLTPAFNKDKTSYDAQVAPNVSKVTVSYRASDTAGGSTVSVGAAGGVSSASDNEVTLDVAGMTTTITVTVTAEDTDTAAKLYVIRVYHLRSLPSANTRLADTDGLTVSQGTLVPDYDPDAKMYDVNVDHGISAITVTATAAAEDVGATVAITPNGGSNVALAAGARTAIRITITAEDGVTEDAYMVHVYRKRATSLDDATLSALSLSAGTLSPAFMSDTIEYNARVANSVDEVTVSATLSDNAGGGLVEVETPGPDASCTGADNVDAMANKVSLDAGDNTTICVTATAEDGSTKVYSIIVYRIRANPSTDSNLAVFAITEAARVITDLDGDGEADTVEIDGTASANTLSVLTDMNPDVVYRVRQVTVTATAVIGSTVTILPADSETGTLGHQVNLSPGAETMIIVTVQPEDSAVPSKTYTANVYRKNVPGSESDDATLSSLMLSGGVLTPVFASGTMEYEAAVGRTEMTTVSAIATHIGAQSSVQIGTRTGDVFDEGDDADDDIDGWQVALTDGQEVTIAVKVTAEDGETTETYTVTTTLVAGGTLLEMYDSNEDSLIDLTEVSAAIDDFFARRLSLDDLSTIIDLYFQ